TEIDPTTTAIEVSLHLDPSLGVDRLSVSGTVGGMQAFAPGMVPDDPRPLAADESFAILVPDSLDGETVLVRVDGLANNGIVMSGGVEAPIQLHHVTDVDLTMGAPAICGDGVIRDPLETCDDDNVRPGDGCSATCETEPGWICNSTGGLASCHLDTFDVVSA